MSPVVTSAEGADAFEREGKQVWLDGVAPLMTPEPDCGDHEGQSKRGNQDEGGHQAKKKGAGESAGNGSDGHSKDEQAVMAKDTEGFVAAVVNATSIVGNEIANDKLPATDQEV